MQTYESSSNDKLFLEFKNVLCKNVNNNKFMYLSIFVDGDDELKSVYVSAAEKHNQKMINDPHLFDAGFDIFLPKNNSNPDEGTGFFGTNWNNASFPNKVDFKIKCSAKMCAYDYNKYEYNTGFYLYPRSSLGKTPLRLSNGTGIIDAGYRGNLIGLFDCLKNIESNVDSYDWYMEKYSRLLQICSPNLDRIFVKIVDNAEYLGLNTSRGSGGFGSTGI
jgi:hypothetical protein